MSRRYADVCHHTSGQLGHIAHSNSVNRAQMILYRTMFFDLDFCFSWPQVGHERLDGIEIWRLDTHAFAEQLPPHGERTHFLEQREVGLNRIFHNHRYRC